MRVRSRFRRRYSLLTASSPRSGAREDFAASAGEGQFFTFTPRFAGAKAIQLRIVPGNPASAATVITFDRPHRLGIVSAHGAWHASSCPTPRTTPSAPRMSPTCSSARSTAAYSVVIESTYGPDRGTTAIAEARGVPADGERIGGGEAALAQVVATGKDGATAASQALARYRGLPPALLRSTPSSQRRPTPARGPGSSVRSVRSPIRTYSALRRTRRSRIAIAQGWLHERDLCRDKRSPRFPVRSARRRSLPRDRRRRWRPRREDRGAVHALRCRSRRAGPRSCRSRSHCGTAPYQRGDRDAQRGTDRDAPAERRRQAGIPLPSAILWRAITRYAHHVNVADRPRRAGRDVGCAGRLITDYERRYRLIDGIAAIGDAHALDALARLLGTLAAGSKKDEAERAAFAPEPPRVQSR